MPDFEYGHGRSAPVITSQQIDRARSVTAACVARQWSQNPDWTREQVADQLRDLLATLGLLPAQEPERRLAMSATPPRRSWNDGNLNV